MTTFILIVGLILLAVAVAILDPGARRATRAEPGGRRADRRLRLPGLRLAATTAPTSGARTSLGELPTAIGAWLGQHFGNRARGGDCAAGSSRQAGTRRRRPRSSGYRLLGAIGVTFGFLVLGARRGAEHRRLRARHRRRGALRLVPALDDPQPQDGGAAPPDRPRAARADRPARRHGRGRHRLQRLPAARRRRSSTARWRRSCG